MCVCVSCVCAVVDVQQCSRVIVVCGKHCQVESLAEATHVLQQTLLFYRELNNNRESQVDQNDTLNIE